MTPPLLSTFVSTETQVKTAIESGADHLILEDSKCATRCFSNDFNTKNVNKIMTLHTLARSLNPTITFSINIDFLYHEDKRDILDKVIEIAKKCTIIMFRIQDPGLIHHIKQHYPEAQFHLNLETSNQNALSLDYYAQHTTCQTLNNETPYPELLKLCKPHHNSLEIQVFGPLLIQYSKRRFMAGRRTQNNPKYPLESEHNPMLTKYAEDQDYQHRLYVFHDNPHGHFMYLYFDKCLLKYIPQLSKLNLKYWLIDARGESLDYLEKGLKIFKKEALKFAQNPKEWTLAPYDIESLQNTAKKPLKPGFFRANNTDQERDKYDPLVKAFNLEEEVGQIIDYKKGKWVVIEPKRHMKTDHPYYAISPEGKMNEVKLQPFFNLDGSPLDNVSPFTIFKTRWQKGMLPYAKLYSKA